LAALDLGEVAQAYPARRDLFLREPREMTRFPHVLGEAELEGREVHDP